MSPENKYKVDLRDAVWVLGMGAQGGFVVASPALIGLGVGLWLDNRFGTLPWITIIFTLVGGLIGPFMLYRWVTTSVAQRVEKRMKTKRESEEKPE